MIGCTTNPGYSDKFAGHLFARGIRVYYNPEFIAQGTIINDMRTADMVLCGGEDEEGFDTIKGIFEDIQDTPVRFHEMSRTAAEITKIGINCFLTYKISYANMMGQILYNSGCGNEIDSILSSIGDDSRIGSKYLRYGLFSGSLFAPRQPCFSYTMLIELVYSIVSLRSRMTSMIHMQSLSVTIVSNRTLTISHILSRSIAFKKGSDMVVESPRYRLVTDLLERGYTVYVQDISDVIDKYADDLYDKYDDRIIFVRNESSRFMNQLGGLTFDD